MAKYTHTRSISLTSSPHPLIQSFEEELSRFDLDFQEATPFSCLGGLKDLYDRVEEVLQLSLVRRALSQSELAEEAVLDGSLRLLDVCGTAREVLSQLKQCLQDLASSFRRRKGGESGLVLEVGAYMSSRKKLNNKVVAKCLAKLKRKETIKKCASDEACLLQEAESIGLCVLESLLCSVSQLPKHRTWSLVSRLVQSKRLKEDRNVLEKLDMELVVLCGTGKCGKDMDLVRLQHLLEEVELSIQELEEELESVFRRLVKTRVALLNIFNH